ncbi:MAG: alginate lyase family protein [Planctomycetota bacterium]|jgi:hypothetical protein
MEGLLKRGGRVCLTVWTIGIITPGTASAPTGGGLGIWITPQELATLTTEGPAWEELIEEANEPAGIPNISDAKDDTDVRTMAKALVFARTGEEAYRQEVIQTCLAAIGTEVGGRTLALGRNLLGYVIAADLVELPPEADAVFRAWLDQVRYEDLDGRTLISTHEDRPNNWGTVAGACRMAAAVYLGDTDDLHAAAMVFKGWLGDREAYAGFDYGELWWEADPDEPVGINRASATIQGHSVDGALPDDQRRGGPFQWPPPHENYVYSALQGSVAQAEILHRQGYDAWNWEDRAMLRAFQWLHNQAHYPAEGDDEWQPHLVNFRYGTLLPAPTPARHGKNAGWTDWTHASCNADLDGDGFVGAPDFLGVLATWGTDPGGPPDFDRNGVVRIDDVLALLARWGPCD